MPRAPRVMRLTEQHLARLPALPDDGLPLAPRPGAVRSTREDHLETVRQLFGEDPEGGEAWFFGYGSLLWKPACDVVEMRTGIVRGWHRSFCLGWNTRHRGSEAKPGLMLALDRGGACKGVLYRVPPDAVVENLVKLFEREMGWRPSGFPPRMLTVTSGERTIRAVTFCVDRRSDRYVSGLPIERVADVLATAVGTRGSMAQYLFATVARLEAMGIHDPYLWALQEMVAERIEAVHGA